MEDLKSKSKVKVPERKNVKHGHGQGQGPKSKFFKHKHNSPAVPVPPTRKELRKQKRKARKTTKNQFQLSKFGHTPVEPIKKKRRQKNRKRDRRGKKSDAGAVAGNAGSKSSGHGAESDTDSDSASGSESNNTNTNSNSVELRNSKISKLQKQMEITRKKRLLEDNQDEEKYISSLGKKLKLNKKAVIPASFRTDGLDYLLEFCENLNKSKSEKSKKEAEADEAEADSEESEFSDMDEAGEEVCDNEEEGIDDSAEEDEVDEAISMSNSGDSETDLVDSDSEDSENEVLGTEEEAENEETSELWEDIYGRFRDAQGNVVTVKTPAPVSTAPISSNPNTKYIPPNRREISASSKTSKLLKGLLNRLSESNMHSIASQIESAYMASSRNEMNENLLVLILSALVQPVQSSERLILEHTLLIAILHANVGMEIGAFFIQSFVQKFRSLYDQFQEEIANAENDGENSKEMENLILLICYMYHFKIVDSSLIYDILNFLSGSFGPKDIELILTVLRSVGFRLRKDNPLALKSLILTIQEKASKSTECSSRVKFMLETLLAIRNNNMSKIPNYDPTYGEHLSKTIKVYFHPGNYVSELKISMDDLLNANTKGKWWIVGSAWTGTGSTGDLEKSDPSSNPGPSDILQFNQKLLAKAKAQGMNTDTRKTIFCILMTAEDYLDAFEKLMKLGLKNQLERELVHVPIYCCLHEKKWNPYYGLLLGKLCGMDRRFMLTVQYSLWDRLKDLGSLSPVQLSNLSSLIVHLINDRSLPITLLRVLDFADMDTLKFNFLNQILTGILEPNPPEIITDIFIKVGLGSEKLSLFKEGLALFLGHFMLKGEFVNGDGETISLELESKNTKLNSKIKIAEKAMRLGSKRVLL